MKPTAEICALAYGIVTQLDTLDVTDRVRVLDVVNAMRGPAAIPIPTSGACPFPSAVYQAVNVACAQPFHPTSVCAGAVGGTAYSFEIKP